MHKFRTLVNRNRLASFLLLGGLSTAGMFLTGCGMFNASGQVGPNLKPHFGTSLSVPLGK